MHVHRLSVLEGGDAPDREGSEVNGFRKLPTWWTRSGNGLKCFRGGKESGTSLAALKCLLAITLMADFRTMIAKVSYSDFMALTNLSKPMIPRAIAKLEGERIIRVCRVGNTNEYQLWSPPEADNYWAKVPYDRVRDALRNIPNRGEVTLSALKIYIQLLALRRNDVKQVWVSYDNLRDRTGLQKIRIRPGLDVLFSHLLIHIQKVEDFGQEQNPTYSHNVYTITGDLRL